MFALLYLASRILQEAQPACPVIDTSGLARQGCPKCSKGLIKKQVLLQGLLASQLSEAKGTGFSKRKVTCPRPSLGIHDRAGTSSQGCWLGDLHATLLPLSVPEQLGKALQLAPNRTGWWKTEPFTRAEEGESQPVPQQGNSKDPELMIDQDVSELLERGTFRRGAERKPG